MLNVLLHFDMSLLWLSGGRSSKGQKQDGQKQKNGKRSGHAFDPEKKGSYFDRRSHETSDI